MNTPTNEQKKVIEDYNSNSKVIACAGSGKTKTMVDRIIELTNNNVDPSEIIVLSFTNESSKELSSRIIEKYREVHGDMKSISNMFIGTFHSFAMNLIVDFLDTYKNYEFIDDIQSKLFLKRYSYKFNQYMKEINFTKYVQGNHNQFSVYDSNSFGAFINFVNFVREELIYSELSSVQQKGFDFYRNELHTNKILDYSEVLYILHEKLKTDDEFAKSISATINYVIFDEFQDVNTIQYKILKLISENNDNTVFCVVGDDDQSIYQWRGSRNEFIINFESDFKDVNKYPLSENFRSSPGIVDVADKIIRLNPERIDKTIISAQKQVYDKGDIQLIKFDNDQEEYDYIIEKIRQLRNLNDGEVSVTYGEMAVLVRSTKKLNDKHPELIQMLEDNEIPFVIGGLKNLLEAPEVKLLIETIKSIYEENIVSKEVIDGWNNILQNDADISGSIDSSIKYLNDYCPERTTDYKKFEFTISELIQPIIFYAISKLDEENGTEEKKIYNLSSFTSIVTDFEKVYYNSTMRMREFVKYLDDDLSNVYDEGWLSKKFEPKNLVRLMTIHQSKGLQFTSVWLPFVDKDMYRVGGGGLSSWHLLGPKFDYLKDIYNEKKQSDNRLFYVAVTRSKKFLFCTNNKNHYPKRVKKDTTGLKHFNSISLSDYHVQEDINLSDIKVNIVNIEAEELKVALDFSTLKEFYECPYKFKLRHLYGITSPINVRMGYGKSLHNILEYIHKAYQEGREDEIKSPGNLAEKMLYLPYGEHLPKLKKDTIARIGETIKNYLKSNDSDKLKRTMMVEQKISYMVGEYIFINGRIDLIRDEVTNEVTLVDFKSDNKVLSSDLLEKQLLIYALGYKYLTGETANNIESYDLNSSNAFRRAISEEKMSGIENELYDIYDTIKSNSYSKTNEEFCKKSECDFYGICRSTKQK